MPDAAGPLTIGAPPSAGAPAGSRAVLSPRARYAAQSLLEAAAAVVVIIAGTMWLDRSSAWLRVLLVIAGLCAGYLAIGHAAQAALGRKADIMFGLCLGWLASLAFCILLAPVLPLGVYADSSKTLLVPGFLRPDLFSSHPLGTNQQGLDMLSRVIWGGRESLTAAILAVVIGNLIGGLLGVVAGYFGGAADRLIGIGTSVGLAFPADPPAGRRGHAAQRRHQPGGHALDPGDSGDDPDREGEHAGGRAAGLHPRVPAARRESMAGRAPGGHSSSRPATAVPCAACPATSHRGRGVTELPRARRGRAAAQLGKHDQRGRQRRL